MNRAELLINVWADARVGDTNLVLMPLDAQLRSCTFRRAARLIYTFGVALPRPGCAVGTAVRGGRESRRFGARFRWRGVGEEGIVLAPAR